MYHRSISQSCSLRIHVTGTFHLTGLHTQSGWTHNRQSSKPAGALQEAKDKLVGPDNGTALRGEKEHVVEPREDKETLTVCH